LIFLKHLAFALSGFALAAFALGACSQESVQAPLAPTVPTPVATSDALQEINPDPAPVIFGD
jgi:hypothetical protein